MNLSAWAIRKPIPSVLLFIMLTAAGLIAFQKLGIQKLPDVDFPSVTVTSSLPGASPVQLEAEVARPIEDAIASIEGIRHVTTTINDGVVSTMVEFGFDKNLDEAVSDIRDSVTRIRSTLPTELQEPVVARVTLSGLPILTYAVSAADMDEADLSWYIDDRIRKNLLQIHGVAQVTRQGGVSREVIVNLDPVKLQAMKVTAGEISRQLRSVQQEAPGGRGNIGGLEQAVRTVGIVSSASELGNLSIPLVDGRRLRLSDVADVRDTIAERRALALLDGKPVVSFQVMRARGYDDVATGQRVRAAVAQLQQSNPRVRIVEVWNTVDPCKADYDVAMHMLYEGAILAVIVVWFFLKDWRATAISAIALPLSIIPTFLIMSIFGYSLNSLSLVALTLVIGILVDDAIVEVENIMRHLQMGKSSIEAARDAADEIGLAVVATSLTLVAVFLPTALSGGITGVFFRQFGNVASAAVLFSLLVARLLTPMLAAYFLKPQPHPPSEGPLMERFLTTVRWCLEHPRMTVGIAGAVFLGSLLLISQLPSAYLGKQDTSTEVVLLEGPPGNTLEQTAELAERARKVLVGIPEVRAVYTAIGAGVQTGDMRTDLAAPEVRIAQVTLRFIPKEEWKRKYNQILVDMRDRLADIPGVHISIGRGTPGEKMDVMLVGDEPETLSKAARAVERDLRTIPGIGAVTSSANLLRPEIVIRPDFVRAAKLGITSDAIGQAVRVATTGDFDFNLTRLNLPSRQLYVRVQLDPSSRRDPNLVQQLRVMGEHGAAVPLGNIAQISVADGPAQIDRYDRHRYIKLSVDLQGRPIGNIIKAANAQPSMMSLPPGVKVVPSGDLEYMDEMYGEFGIAMLAGIFCVYALMVLLFHDFGQPITVLAALPLSSCGALGLLWVFGFTLSMMALIGLLMLVGIVTKNSILLVEYAIMARRDLGMNRSEALLDACRKRVRPIIMTTVAMAAGMLPIATGILGDDSFRVPMAVVVIGGLITSTVLSLLVVPVVYEIVDDVKQRFFPQAMRASQTSGIRQQAEQV